MNIKRQVYPFKGDTWDDKVKAVVEIDCGHNQIHEGNSFTICDTVACDTNTVKWQINTSSVKDMHVQFEMSGDGAATFLVTEDSDRIDGTVLTPLNRNRNIPMPTSASIISRTPTNGATDGATVLFSKRDGIVGLGGKSVQTGSVRTTNEWILKRSTKYVISITTYAASFVTCLLDWYEV